MNSKLFGSLVAGAVAGMLMTGTAVAKDGKKKGAKKEAKQAGWCKSNECGGKVMDKDGNPAKNGCGGQMACKGITKELCEKDGAGTWTTEPKPGK